MSGPRAIALLGQALSLRQSWEPLGEGRPTLEGNREREQKHKNALLFSLFPYVDSLPQPTTSGNSGDTSSAMKDGGEAGSAIPCNAQYAL